MSIDEIFKDAFVYPSKNLKIFVIIGALVLLYNYGLLGFNYSLLGFQASSFIEIILFLVYILIGSLLLPGYFLSIIRETINGSDDIPSFNIVKNVVDSVKLYVVHIVYTIPLIFILLISAYALNLFGIISEFISYWNLYGSEYLNHVPPELMLDFGLSLLIMSSLASILPIFFMFITYIAEMRLAKFNQLKAAFQIRSIYNDISKIGWGKYIAWFLILYVIIGIISVIYVIAIFGIIGFVIASFFAYTYLQIFIARNKGLIYKTLVAEYK